MEHLIRQKESRQEGGQPPVWILPCTAQCRNRKAHRQCASPVKGNTWARQANQSAVTAHPTWFRFTWHQSSWCGRGSLPLSTQTAQTFASAVCAEAACQEWTPRLLFHSFVVNWWVSNWTLQQVESMSLSKKLQGLIRFALNGRY